MLSHSLNRVARDLAIEQSLDAAIEVNDVIKGERSESPALSVLVHTLMGAGDQGDSPQSETYCVILSSPAYRSVPQRFLDGFTPRRVN